MHDEIRVYVKEPFYAPELRRIPNTLEALQKIVGGYIETVTLSSNMVIICNEEGRMLELPYNCDVCGVGFCGTIIFAGIDGEEFADVPEAFVRMVEDHRLYCANPETEKETEGGGDE